jgi:hypothetical protein
MTAYASLLNTVKNLQEEDSKARLHVVHALLKNTLIRDELSNRQVRRQLLAERFNVFAALGLDRRENYHSRFLAYLLDTQGDHDQGSFFLERFLHTLKEMNSQFPESLIVHEGTSRVVPEQFADADGRIDLVIYLANHVVIAIENKIDHFEGERQLPRYRNWLKSLKPVGYPKFLIFLTPDRREPASAKDREDSKVDLILGYGDLVNWLDKCIIALPVTASRLVTVLVQYQQLCRTISGELNMKTLKDEILNLIRQPENLKAALEIAKHLDFEKKSIEENFRKNVVFELRKRLAEAELSTWRASSDYKNGVFGLHYQTHINDKSANYICGIEKLFAPAGCFGWCRPKWIDPKEFSNVDTASLSRQMQGDDQIECNNWWVGRKPIGNPFNQWDEEAIVVIDNDNRQSEHLLAKELADQVWKMFIAYRDEIGKLTSFEQAAKII